MKIKEETKKMAQEKEGKLELIEEELKKDDDEQGAIDGKMQMYELYERSPSL